MQSMQLVIIFYELSRGDIFFRYAKHKLMRECFNIY